MKKEELKRAWLTAAAISFAVIAAIFIYAVAVEAVSRFADLRPPLTGPAAAAVKYALYILGVGAVFALKFIRPPAAGQKTPQELLKALMSRTAVTAAVCEVPAFFGLMIFFLTGGYWDFYMLAGFSVMAGLFNFPRYPRWEEDLRNKYGLIPE